MYVVSVVFTICIIIASRSNCTLNYQYAGIKGFSVVEDLEGNALFQTMPDNRFAH